MNYMSAFIEISNRMGKLWSSDNVNFTKYGKICEACYKTNTHGDYLPGDVILYWDVTSNSISVNVYDTNKNWIFLYSEGDDSFLHPRLTEFVNKYPHLKDLIPVSPVMINNIIKDVDNEIFGEAIFHEICSEYSGSLEEIGECLKDVILSCKTKEQYDLVNNTVIAISGSSLETILNIVKENSDIERE